MFDLDLALTCDGCRVRRASLRLCGRSLCPNCAHATIDRAAPRDTAAADDARVLVWARGGVDVRQAGGLPRHRRDAAIERLTAHGDLVRRTVTAQDQFGRQLQHVQVSVAPVSAPAA